MGSCEGQCSQNRDEKLGVRQFVRSKIYKNRVEGDAYNTSICEGNYKKTERCSTELCIKRGTTTSTTASPTTFPSTKTSGTKPIGSPNFKTVSTDKSTDVSTDKSTDVSTDKSTDVRFDDSTGCCPKIYIDFTRDSEDKQAYMDPYIKHLYPKNNWEITFVKDKEINGKHSYKSKIISKDPKKPEYAMWWKEGYWMVGQYRNRNTHTALAFAKSWENCPEIIHYSWKYYSYTEQTYHPAGQAMSVFDCCTYSESPCVPNE